MVRVLASVAGHHLWNSEATRAQWLARGGQKTRNALCCSLPGEGLIDEWRPLQFAHATETDQSMLRRWEMTRKGMGCDQIHCADNERHARRVWPCYCPQLSCAEPALNLLAWEASLRESSHGCGTLRGLTRENVSSDVASATLNPKALKP